MKNLHLLFYKSYYDQLNSTRAADAEKLFQKTNAQIFKTEFSAADYVSSPLSEKEGYCTICMKTVYPGLMAGIGYAHGAGIKNADSDINCGFSFDYVTGQPYIPGSSVKGMLSSAFRHPDLIQDILNMPGLNADDISLLGKSIFGDDDGEGTDVFLDAVICSGDSQKHILGGETITPHGEDITKNPIPLQMIKILPDVTLEFRFILKDSVITGQIFSAKKKKWLFLKILEFLGVGAKTSTGYGNIIPAQNPNLNAQQKHGNIANHHAPEAVEPITAKSRSDIRQRGVYYATVISTIPCRVELCEGLECEMKVDAMKLLTDGDAYKKGAVTKVRVDNIKGTTITISEVQ